MVGLDRKGLMYACMHFVMSMRTHMCLYECVYVRTYVCICICACVGTCGRVIHRWASQRHRMLTLRRMRRGRESLLASFHSIIWHEKPSPRSSPICTLPPTTADRTPPSVSKAQESVNAIWSLVATMVASFSAVATDTTHSAQCSGSSASASLCSAARWCVNIAWSHGKLTIAMTRCS